MDNIADFEPIEVDGVPYFTRDQVRKILLDYEAKTWNYPHGAGSIDAYMMGENNEL